MIRVARRAAATLLLALALALPGTSVALAATPTPSPVAPASKVVQYSGTGTTTNPGHPEYAANADVLTTTATVDCNGSPCTVTAIVTDGDNGNLLSMTNGQPVALTDGKADVPVGGPADALCTEDAFPPGRFTATASGDSITVTRTFEVAQTESCTDGSTVQTVGGYVYVATLATTAGAGCVATGTCPTPTPQATREATPTAAPASASGGLGGTPHSVRIADPSVLSVLPTTATALTAPNILWAVAATVVLVLLIAFPSHLLNSATEAGTDRVSEWWTARRRRARPAAAGEPSGAAGPAEPESTEPPEPVNLAGWPLAAAGVLVASLISSFVDPSFGLNAASIRVFLSILLSFLLDAVLGWFLLILLVRRANPAATARFRFAPASLLVVVVAVLFTRLTGFAPGIVFGLVAGVVFGAIVATADKARLTLIGLGYSFVLAMVAWTAYSALADSLGAHPAAPIVFVQETLASMAIGGIAALPIVLVPLRGMAGFELWTWNRWVWGGAYVVGLLGFFLVLMPRPFSWATVGLSVWAWVGIYVAYAATALVLWLVITRPWRREESPGSVPRRDVQSPDAVAEP